MPGTHRRGRCVPAHKGSFQQRTKNQDMSACPFGDRAGDDSSSWRSTTRMKTDSTDQIVIPLHAEEVSVGKKQVATGRVKVSTVTHSRQQIIEQLLQSERVEVERVPVGKVVARPPTSEPKETSPSFPWWKRRSSCNVSSC